MNNTNTIILDYKTFFPLAVFGGVFYFYSFYATIGQEHHKVFMSIIFILIMMAVIYTIIFSMEIVELNAETITIHTFFKLGSTKKLNMKNLVKILQKPDYREQLTRIVLVFSNGKRVELNQFQRGFLEANTLLRENFPDEMFEVQPKWHIW